MLADLVASNASGSLFENKPTSRRSEHKAAESAAFIAESVLGKELWAG